MVGWLCEPQIYTDNTDQNLKLKSVLSVFIRGLFYSFYVVRFSKQVIRESLVVLDGLVIDP